MAVSIHNILQSEGVVTHYQPVASVERRSIIGAEALSRGLEQGTGRVIPPYQLFMAATAEDRAVELEHLCRKKALESFAQTYLKTSEQLLFLNFEVSALDQGLEATSQLVRLVEEMGIPARRVAIEVVESKVESTEALQAFIDQHRQAGFLIALDDIGAGHSNLDRVALLRPDLMKIDASLVRDLDRSANRQEVFRGLVSLARRLGSLTLAEGVETEAEALMALSLGVDFLQGYYLAKPQAADPGLAERCRPQVEALAAAFKAAQLERLSSIRGRQAGIQRLVNRAMAQLAGAGPEGFAAVLMGLAEAEPGLQAIRVIDSMGLEKAEALGRAAGPDRPRFVPWGPGTDHSLRDYFFMTQQSNLKRFVTQPYISLSTGLACVTVAHWFQAGPGPEAFLLCLDLRPEEVAR